MEIDLSYDMLPFQKKVRRAIKSGKKVVLVGGGVRSGKTYCGARESWGLTFALGGRGWIVSPTEDMGKAPEAEFIAATPNWRLIRNHSLRDRKFELITGATIEVKSANNPDALRGFKVNWIWTDEHAYNSGYVHDVLSGRLLDTDGVMLITTTPKGCGFLYHDVYLKSLPNSPTYDSRYFSVHAKTMDNTHVPLAHRKSRLKEWKDKGKFAQQELEGIFVALEGLVYDNWNDKEGIVTDEALTREQRANAIWLLSIDFGWDAPTAIYLIAKVQETYYVWDEIYQRKMEIDDIVEGIRDMENRHKCGFVTRYADSKAARDRATLNRKGIQTKASSQKPGDVDKGIQILYGLINRRQWKVHKRCIMGLRELGMYSYSNVTHRPIDAHNNAMDAWRYVVLGEERKERLVQTTKRTRKIKPVEIRYI